MKLKKVLSLLLALVMTVSLLTLPVHAEGNDFASLTVAEQYAALKSADNEAEAQALFDTLTEQQQTALVTYAQTQAEQEYTVPQTVVFTEAGPFMPPVNVAPVRMKTMARAAVVPAEDDGNGLVFTKKAKDNKDGTYTITMEAYTTGKVTTSTTTAPVDIVLVLDQSGSMAFGFDGNEYASYENSRQYAMKQAVNNFINEVCNKYNAEKSDHRMAIVTFGSNASTLQGWTVVNEAGKNTLQGKISGLPVEPSGATNVAAGMEQAETLMGSGYSYTGTNTQRQKVVIVFTDGVPTTSTDFDTTVATNAIASAKTLKDAGATVYTVGIFTGANPNELYGASGFDTNSDGSIGSKWVKDTWGLFPGTDFPEADRPAGNRFLNYLSSNYPDARSIGLNRSTSGLGILHYKITYKIKDNYTNAASNYYLTANNNASLNSIFQTISENIQTANINLGSETVIKDIISPYFTAPAKSEIKLYTAEAKSDGTFKDRVAAPDTVTATVKDDTVSVTGFNFNDNFVSDKVKSDGTYGKKLIIEFTVTPKAGFLGGNNVPTNGTDSGVYAADGTQIATFDVPTVNVPLNIPNLTASDKNIYLLGTAPTASELGTFEVPTGDDAWKTAYVDIGPITADRTISNTADTKDIGLSVTVKPKYSGTSAEGTPVEAVTKTATANVNVFTPELTYMDSTAYYGEAIRNTYDANRVSEVWKHGNTESIAVTMFGVKPTLDFTYTPDSTKLDGNKYGKNDVPVKVGVKIGNEDVTAYTEFVHTDCASDCGWTTPNPANGNPAFLIHIKTCTLNITKAGGASDETYVFDVYKDGVKYSEVTIQGNDTENLVELPVGTYTIVEDSNWSWRYPNPTYSAENVNLSSTTPIGAITCTNAKATNSWLNGFSAVVRNIFSFGKN